MKNKLKGLREISLDRVNVFQKIKGFLSLITLSFMLSHISPAFAGGLYGEPASKFPVTYKNEGPIIYKASGGSPEPALYSGRTIDIQYLGVSGYLIKWAGQSIMMAPSYSNPDLLKIAKGDTPPIQKNIDEQLAQLSTDGKGVLRTLENVSAILVGHAHYDHLLDVPYLMNNYATNADLYGSTSAKNIVQSAISGGEDRIVDVHGKAVFPGDFSLDANDLKDRWYTVANGRIRFMPIYSDHAPNFVLKFLLCVEYKFGEFPHFCNKEHTHVKAEDPYDDPMRANLLNWKEGQTFAYLVDFLDENGYPVYRMHYGDAASSAGGGHIPWAVREERAVDLGILTVGNFNEVQDGDYPQHMMSNLKATRYILGHWESFFGNTTVNPLCDAIGLLCPALLDIPFNDTNLFIERLITKQYSAGHYWFAKWLGSVENLLDEFAILPEPNLEMKIMVDR